MQCPCWLKQAGSNEWWAKPLQILVGHSPQILTLKTSMPWYSKISLDQDSPVQNGVGQHPNINSPANLGMLTQYRCVSSTVPSPNSRTKQECCLNIIDLQKRWMVRSFRKSDLGQFISNCQTHQTSMFLAWVSKSTASTTHPLANKSSLGPRQASFVADLFRNWRQKLGGPKQIYQYFFQYAILMLAMYIPHWLYQ